MALLLTLEALDLESALMKLRCQNSSSLAHGGLERGRAAQGWMGPGGWTPGWTACAMSKHGCCACAGMFLLPHGTHKHLRRAYARLAGARATSGCLLHATVSIRGDSRPSHAHAAHLMPLLTSPWVFCYQTFNSARGRSRPLSAVRSARPSRPCRHENWSPLLSSHT